MNGITLKIDRGQVNKMLGELTDRMTNSTPAMRKIGAIGRESVRTNFARRGRPVPWKGLKLRRGQPLRDTNRLMNSITSQPGKDSVRIGTNVVYAGVHHFGARKHSFGTFTVQVRPHTRATRSGGEASVRGHARKVKLPWGDIPARPFMVLQDEDWHEIREILAKHIIGGN